ncbi:hypothetical protein BH10BAC5_BH10BAC5_05410 [soil metagenome]
MNNNDRFGPWKTLFSFNTFRKYFFVQLKKSKLFLFNSIYLNDNNN